jgi:potassium/hydrogen antiporter
VLAAYFAADGLQASGFMAVFVFGIFIGNKDSFGFSMGATEQKRLDEFVSTTAFIMRLFIFILLGTQVDFRLMRQNWFGGMVIVSVHADCSPGDGIFLCASRPPCGLELERNAV